MCMAIWMRFVFRISLMSGQIPIIATNFKGVGKYKSRGRGSNPILNQFQLL